MVTQRIALTRVARYWKLCNKKPQTLTKGNQIVAVLCIEYKNLMIICVTIKCHYEFFRDVILKILAHNNLIGRIIGKEGNTIKRIMSETETKITVSRLVECTIMLVL